MRNIFITGGTGFLGSTLICEILSSSDDKIRVLVRGESAGAAEKRLRSIIENMSEPYSVSKSKIGNIEVYTGDITKKSLGLGKKSYSRLIKDTDVIYHCAASTNLNNPYKKIKKVNVDGTKNVLDFALTCKKKGRLNKVNHISTAYVVGNKVCVFTENKLEIGQDFNNAYEKSKYNAEKLVTRYRRKNLDIDIFRPSIMLGRYVDGKATKFKMLYQPLHFLSLELVDRMPVSENGAPNSINVDIAAKAIYLISNSSRRKNMTYHIVSPEASPIDLVLDMASKYFSFTKPLLVPLEEMDLYTEYSAVKRKMVEPYIPYFNFRTHFDMRNTLKELKNKKMHFPKLDKSNLLRLFKYCDKIGFIKRKTIHAAVK